MRRSTWFRAACLLLLAAGVLVMPRPALASAIVPVTLGFESEGLDLDTGAIVPVELLARPRARKPADPQWDLLLTYNSGRAVRAVVSHNRMNGVQIAFLDGVAFNLVDSGDLATLSFTTARVDKSFETGDSIVLRTASGAHYLLGNPIEDAAGVTFDTQLLDQTTAGLLRPATDGPQLTAASLPPGLSAKDWRQIRGLIEEDGSGLRLSSSMDVHEDAKLTASDAADFDEFGISVALSGDTAVVGSQRDDHAGGGDAGSAYVFVRSETGWSEQAKLTASDAVGNDQFGTSVAVWGDTIVVGTRPDAAGPRFGSAYVFLRSGNSWSEQAKLTPSDAAIGDRFGSSVSLSGDTAVVGAFNNDHAGGMEAGSAYVFLRGGTSWSEQAKLTASDAASFDRFGISVTLSGDTAVVGSYFDDHAGGTNAGSAYVFLRSGTSWSEQAKLTASDATGGSPVGPLFGFAVVVSDDTAAVGAPFNDDSGESSGSAYVFLRSGTTWSEQAKLAASDAAANDFFGISVGLSGDTAVVGSYFDDHVGGMDVGSAYVFLRSGTSWLEQLKLAASDAAADDQFGISVALSSGTAAVGAVTDDQVSGVDAGSAYVFQLTFPPVALCRDVTVSAGLDCTADASIDAGSFDPDGDPVTLSQEPSGPYGLGDTLVTLTVTDTQGASDSCLATVTVEDTTLPQLAVVLTPDALWPPNHHMVAITATVTSSDNCATPTVALTSLTSNEVDDDPGKDDGRTTGDIQPGVDDFHFSLRAERAGAGNGRIYTVVYTATDGSGNATSEAGFVVVPHDQSGVIDPVEIVLEQSASGTVVSWAVVSGAVSYDAIRGELNGVVDTGVAISLGTVVCIEANSIDESTLGWEDGELPGSEQTFFYVVEYDDGISSTYGTESAGRPRAPVSGDCQ